MSFYTNVAVGYNDILYRGVNANGDRVIRKIPYQPYLFVPTTKESKFKTIFGQSVEMKKFESMLAAKEWIHEKKDIHNFKFYGNTNWQYCFISDLYLNEVRYDFKKLVILNFDIEVGSEKGFPFPDTALEPITAITMKVGETYYVYGCGEYTCPTDKQVAYWKCEDEEDLLIKFLEKWEQLQPDILTGWNIAGFDIPYLVNRLTNLFGESTAKKLSPWRRISKRAATVQGKYYEVIDLSGISILDYLELYKKFSKNPNQESYTLNHISHVELGEKKLSYEEYGSLHQLYKLNYQKFIDYNLKDVELVDLLEKKMKLIAMVVSVAYDARVNFNDVFAQVRMWDQISHCDLKRKNIVVPQKKHVTKSEAYAGAFVKDPIVGTHEWVCSFDLKSLYPSLMIQGNISPETFIDEELTPFSIEKALKREMDLSYLKEENVTLAANGAKFDITKRGFLAEILLRMMDDRDRAKEMQLAKESELELIKVEMKRRGMQ